MWDEQEWLVRDVVNAFLRKVHASKHTVCPELITLLEEAFKEAFWHADRREMTMWEKIELNHISPLLLRLEPGSEEHEEFTRWRVKLRETWKEWVKE